MLKANVEGQKLGIGDWVGFKADHEMSGEIVNIKPSPMGNGSILTVRVGGADLAQNCLHDVHEAECWTL